MCLVLILLFCTLFSFAIISLRKRELVVLLCVLDVVLLSFVSLSHDATDWSMICDNGIFWSYSRSKITPLATESFSGSLVGVVLLPFVVHSVCLYFVFIPGFVMIPFVLFQLDNLLA